jgi:hypothetical protein
VQKDERRAVELYKQSAEAGSTVGMFNLGWCYEFGVWVPMSKDDALHWYRMAAAKGHKDSAERIRQLEAGK